MGLQGRPWNDCHGAEKDELRKRFDGLKAQLRKTQKPHADIDEILDRIGVIDPE